MTTNMDPEDELNQAEGRDAGVFTRMACWVVFAWFGILGKVKWEYGLFHWWLTHTTICSACKKVLRKPILPWAKPTHLNTSGSYCVECIDQLKKRYETDDVEVVPTSGEAARSASEPHQRRDQVDEITKVLREMDGI